MGKRDVLGCIFNFRLHVKEKYFISLKCHSMSHGVDPVAVPIYEISTCIFSLYKFLVFHHL